MRQPQRHTAATAKRRTTLTLPADSLLQAERIPRSRNVNLSAYKKAFAGFSDEEMLVLDGIILEPAAKRS